MKPLKNIVTILFIYFLVSAIIQFLNNVHPSVYYTDKIIILLIISFGVIIYDKIDKNKMN